ncbi:hypothetical protein GJU39_00535 [Pedobacter petrophilus]|uniref:Uncharacterized protein n=1 Tax=Pedobacter petrophilus TaxID=1908241 RepID=A0A7K0FSH1_9SPHI|nr:hypothetical protein [Pedobacter petrophilus]MRX74558.1 hypothetical protein [Pedobacter petrophilus]
MKIKTALSISLLFIFFSIALLIVSCNQSTLTNKDLQDINVISAVIDIHQSLEKQNENNATVELYDSERHEIRNDTIKVFINGSKFDYTVENGLYYTKDYYYYNQNFEPIDNKYKLEIELPNGKRFFLAEIMVLKPVKAQDVLCAKNGNLDKDFAFSWKNMGDVNQLIIEKSIKTTNPKEPTVTTYNSDMDTLKISNAGSFVIPKAGKNEQVSILNFIANQIGTLNPKLLKNSQIAITGELEIRLETGL